MTSYVLGRYLSGANDSNGGTSEIDAWLTLSKANTTMVAGDDTTIHSGTYSETAIPSNSGTLDTNRITYNVNTGEVVTTKRVNVENKSFVTVNDLGIADTAILRASNANGITMDGITFPGQTAAGGNPLMRFNNTTNSIIRNCTFTADHSFYSDVFIINGASNHNLIEDNTWSVTGSGGSATKTHSFIQLNGVGGYGDLDPRHNFIRNNTFLNDEHHVIEFKDGSIDNYFDNNLIKQAGTGTKGVTRYQGKAIGMWSSDTRVRWNKVFKSGQKDDVAATMFNGWASNENGSDENKVTGNYVVHNSFARAWGVPMRMGSSWDGVGSTASASTLYDMGNNVFKNNIFYDNNFHVSSSFGDILVYYHTFGTNKNESWGDVWSGNLFENLSASATLVYHLGTSYTLANAEANITQNDFTANVTGNPQFTDIDNFDLTLQATSGAIDSGLSLTTTDSATSGTTLRVGDGKYFTGGRGVITGDIIMISATTATVSSVTGNTLELQTSKSWNAGDAVNFVFSGTSPDIGAEQFTAPTSSTEAGSITFDAVSSGNDISISAINSPLSFSHTIGGNANRYLVVGVAFEEQTVSAATISTVTYNGVGLTKAVSKEIKDVSNKAVSELWYLTEASLPAAGSYTVEITPDSFTINAMYGGAVSVYGAKQQAPEALSSTSNSLNTISTTITTISDNAWIIDSVACGDTGTYTPDGTQTERVDQTDGVRAAHAMSTLEKATAGSQSVGWTHSSGTPFRQAYSVLVIAPAPGTGISVAPTNGTLTYTGYSPLLNPAVEATITPITGLIIFARYEPNISLAVTMSVGGLTVTSYSPIITSHSWVPKEDFETTWT